MPAPAMSVTMIGLDTAKSVFQVHAVNGAGKAVIRAWFKKSYFQVTPEIDRALIVRGFLVLGVTLKAPLIFKPHRTSH